MVTVNPPYNRWLKLITGDGSFFYVSKADVNDVIYQIVSSDPLPSNVGYKIDQVDAFETILIPAGYSLWVKACSERQQIRWVKATLNAGDGVSVTRSRVTAINGAHPTYKPVTGTVDGVNRVFTMPEDYVPETMRVFYKSGIQYDFIEGPASNQVTLGFAPKPRQSSPGQELIFDYEKIDV